MKESVKEKDTLVDAIESMFSEKTDFDGINTEGLKAEVYDMVKAARKSGAEGLMESIRRMNRYQHSRNDNPFEAEPMILLSQIEMFYKILYPGDTRFLTKEQAQTQLESSIEDGWVPSELRDVSCSCHLSAPCRKCCLDGEYLDEFCEEKKIEIIESVWSKE